MFSVGFKPELIDLEQLGEFIFQTQTAKLFRILFDRRLSFNDHTKDLMAKVYRRLNLLKLLKGTNWGARPYTILKAYNCFICPVLEYGALITGALRESQVKKMQILQNKCRRLAVCVTYQSSELSITPLHEIKTRLTDIGWTPEQLLPQRTGALKGAVLCDTSKQWALYHSTGGDGVWS